jgi:hypothetical protein
VNKLQDTPRVFVVHEATKIASDGSIVGAKDLRRAARYGRLVHVVPRGPRFDRTVGETIAIIEEVLDDIRPEDYLLLIGDPDWICIAGAVAAWNLGGHLRVLRWDNKLHDYEVEWLSIPSMMDDLEGDDTQALDYSRDIV